MPKVYIGCVVQRKPPAHYYESLSYVEFSFGTKPPKTSVLEKWRKEIPGDMRIGIDVGPRQLSYDTWDKGYEKSAQWIVDSARALQASEVVLSTGAEISPGPRDRTRFAALVKNLRDRGLASNLVWRFGGVWELESARSFASELGVVVGQDPITDDYDVPKAYARLAAMGARAKLSDGVLEAVATAILEQDDDGETIVALEAEDAFRKAKRLVSILTAVAAGNDLELEEASQDEEFDDEDESDEELDDEELDDEELDDEDD